MITRVWWFMVVAFGSAWLLADVLIVKAAVPVYLMQASLVLLVAGVTVDIMRAKAARSAPVVPLPLVPHSAMIVHRAIDQEQYAALLRSDKEASVNGFENLLDCRRCRKRAAWINVTHPIWDGPFDDGGSGRVDVRQRVWCVRCDGPPPDPSGAPIRLPYLDNLPIRLLPELYARPPFHRLVMPVEPYVAPPPTTDKPAVDPETLCRGCHHAFMWHVGAGGQSGCTVPGDAATPLCRCAKFEAI